MIAPVYLVRGSHDLSFLPGYGARLYYWLDKVWDGRERPLEGLAGGERGQVSSLASLQFSWFCSLPHNGFNPRLDKKASYSSSRYHIQMQKGPTSLVPDKSKETFPRSALSRPPLTFHWPGLGHSYPKANHWPGK